MIYRISIIACALALSAIAACQKDDNSSQTNNTNNPPVVEKAPCTPSDNTFRSDKFNENFTFVAIDTPDMNTMFPHIIANSSAGIVDLYMIFNKFPKPGVYNYQPNEHIVKDGEVFVEITAGGTFSYAFNPNLGSKVYVEYDTNDNLIATFCGLTFKEGSQAGYDITNSNCRVKIKMKK